MTNLKINSKSPLTQEKVKSMYSYCYETGQLISKKFGIPVGHLKRNGYKRISIGGFSYGVHAIIWLYVHGELPGIDIDHINHDRADNHINNLRLVTRQGNMRNASMSNANTSGFTGVTWCKQTGKWRSSVMVSGKYIDLGRYQLKDHAVEARKQANVEFSFHENHGTAYA